MSRTDEILVEQLRASLDRHERLPGEWTCEAAGESFHQHALEMSVLDRPRDVRKEVKVTAELIHESDNHRDPQAIRVEIDQRKIGYIPKDTPEYHRAALLVLLEKGVRLFADAKIIVRSDNERGPRHEVCVELPDTATLIDLLRANE